MSARFTDTEIWKEDWFCEMSCEYQHFTRYIFDHCDNAGVWKPNKFDFETKAKVKVSLDSMLQQVNRGQQRILLLDNGRWFIAGYILFQWFNKKKTFDLVLSNPLHKSLVKILNENKISLKKVRGLREVLKGSMVMVKEEETEPLEIKGGTGGIEINLKISLPQNVLEAVEQNQFLYTKKKNTQFVQSQWLVFLSERMNEPNKKYPRITDLTSHFINWIRNKFPKDGTDRKVLAVGADKLGTSDARIETARNW
jgi:hypothetical protein